MKPPTCSPSNEWAALKGSKRWLQIAVNRCPEVINEAIAAAMRLKHGETIKWLSPLESECFTEYRDCEFLKCLCLGALCPQLEEFWPKGGPVWDGLAKTSRGRRLLIEAKANIPEFDSSPTRASERSLPRIEEALNETKEFLKVRSGMDWSKSFYQYANRLAHLYFLRERNKVNAALVFVYFVGDTTVAGRDPVSREGWQTAIEFAHHHLGLPANAPWIGKNVTDVFIDIGDLDHIPWP